LKWTYSRAKVGRPGVMKEIRALIIRMAEENPGRGYCRIQGGLKSLDHQVARSTIAKVLKEHGIAPGPDRLSSWRTFIKSHAAVIAAADFFTTEVRTARGLVTQYTLFSEQFKTTLRNSGTKTVRTSIQAPNMNGFAERFVRSIKSECLDRMIFAGGDSLDRAIREFAIHYHAERPHQGLENTLICGGPTMSEGRLAVRDRLGGLLRYYYRGAA
jgi:hypothetical protein